MTLLWRRWPWAIVSGLLLIAGLIAIAWHVWDRPVTAQPALWRISQGERHGWLFGTIHSVPSGARWLSPAIEKAANESNVLVLEATGLEAERNSRAIFEKLGRTNGLPPVTARLSGVDRERFAALVKASPQALGGIDGYEDWAAALLIGAAANGASGAASEDAPEARLEALFKSNGRRVSGLETIEAQLSLFDHLPEADQQQLLSQAVEEASDAPRQFAQLYDRWAAGDLRALDAQFLKPLASRPRLRVALIEQRNALWAAQIDRLLRDDGKTPFIAVGSGHLLGAGSVIAMLAEMGWRVERIQ